MSSPITEEVWKPVVGYEGLYEVSDHGRVRSVERVLNHPHIGMMRKHAVCLSQFASRRNGMRSASVATGEEIGRAFGVSKHTVNKIVKREAWKHVN